MIQDVLSQLLETSFKGIPFPTGPVGLMASLDVAVHKRYKRNGGYVEVTGRNPREFTVEIPFLQGLARAEGETWGNLYPETYSQFIAAFEEATPGDFVHPIHGAFLAVCTSIEAPIDPEGRSGVIVQATFTETLADPDDDQRFSQEVEGPSADRAFLDAESTFGTFFERPNFGAVTDLFDAIGDVVDQVSAVRDTVTLTGDIYMSKVTRAVSDAGKLVDMVVEDTTAPPSYVHARQSAEKLYSALVARKNAYADKFNHQTIEDYVVPSDVSLIVLIRQLKQDTKTFIRMNPSLLDSSLVEEGTTVRYLKG